MENWPLELIQRMLAHLDLASLRNAALSCRTFLVAFNSAEVLITSEILLRQIDLDVLPEAILVHKSSLLGKPSVDKGIKFANTYLKSRTPAPSQWRLVDALPLERFHHFVNYFANTLANEALEKQPRLLALGEQPKPSCEEIHRFERALYRFQLYCNVVGDVFPEDLDKLRDMFFVHFAAWENEQLACIHEYLMRVVAKPFNYLVDHDITWGYLGVLYICHHSSEYGQFIISRGLEMAYRLSTASTYQQWHALLSKGEERGCEPYTTGCFLYRGFEVGPNISIMTYDSLSNLNEEDRRFVAGSPFYDDPDRGPVSMWEWVYRDQLLGFLVADDRMIRHWQWAYPFWNLSRLQSAALLGDPSISESTQHTELELDVYNTPERMESLEKSQRARARLWNSDGTGYWSAENQEEVVWPRRKPRPSLSANLRALEARRLRQGPVPDLKQK
ncbi:hypothetical protein F4677DRAFT_415410 [Hypoxylon crocopeplum]|nr:hypothetical protein F4677DRAFT_415410 [Hypoxylon crocopeplum]